MREVRDFVAVYRFSYRGESADLFEEYRSQFGVDEVSPAINITDGLAILIVYTDEADTALMLKLAGIPGLRRESYKENK